MVESYQINRQSRWLGALCTLIICGSVLLILVLILLHTPIPPYPEGGGGTGNGIELNLGFSLAGSGNMVEAPVIPTEIEKPAPASTVNHEKILTQDVEDAPAIADKEPKKNKKATPKPVVAVPVKVDKKETEKPKQVVNTKALYHRSTNAEPAQGSGTVTGNQGNPNGNLGEKAFGGQGGKGGEGGGSGGGKGSGTGPNTGPTASANLQERNPVLPIPEYHQQVEGIVVVSVTVNSVGVVTDATPGVRGSTTLE